MSVISYLLLISPLKVPHCLHLVLNSHSFGYVTGSNCVLEDKHGDKDGYNCPKKVNNVYHLNWLLISSGFYNRTWFLVIFKYSFLISSFVSACLIVSASNIPKYLKFSDAFLIKSGERETSEGIEHSFWRFSFPTFYYEHDPSFNTKFHSYILAVHFYCLYQSLQFFCHFFQISL